MSVCSVGREKEWGGRRSGTGGGVWEEEWGGRRMGGGVGREEEWHWSISEFEIVMTCSNENNFIKMSTCEKRFQ